MNGKHEFKKKWGQNFLSDNNLLSAIVSDAGVDGKTTVLEIGAGAGALTKAIAQRAKRVVAYEIDESLKGMLDEALAPYPNAEVVFGDFQRAEFAALEERLGTYAVVANLPYYITSPVVLKFVEEAKNCTGVTVMVQQEVARRFCAQAGTSDYGAITAAIARKGEAKLTRGVPRSLFYPRPNVDSAVVRIDFTKGGFAVLSPKAYRETVRCAFLSRRKTLENNLMNTFRFERETAREIMRAAQIQEGVRGEVLTPPQLGALSDTLVRAGVIKS